MESKPITTESLNELLTKVIDADRAGIRRKILMLRKYVDFVCDRENIFPENNNAYGYYNRNISSKCKRITTGKNHFRWGDEGETDLSWSCFIDGFIIGAVARNCEHDYFSIVISHEGSDPSVNESKWISIFEEILDKKYEFPEDVIEDMSKLLVEKKICIAQM